MRMPRPPGNSSCSHVYANDAYPASGVHVDCEVLYSLYSVSTLQHSHVHTGCGAALLSDVQLSRASHQRRETDRVGPPKL
jgi:hypothetical protein